MQIDVDNRGKGKTTSLIMDAYFTGTPIITTTVSRRNSVLVQAHNMGMGEDIRVYTVNEVTDKKAVGLDFGEEVYVDELQDVLNFLFRTQSKKSHIDKETIICVIEVMMKNKWNLYASIMRNVRK